jgi:hypothetical protein
VTWLLALRALVFRWRRSVLLLAGFGVGVAVMIVLLAIGEAMLAQARDEKLVGGGDITVLPEGMDLEVMKTGGVGGLYLSIPNARFVNLQLLASPRLAAQVETVSPQIEGKLLYLSARDRSGEWQQWPVRATGEIPSRSRQLGALPPIVAGQWANDSGDSAWVSPDDETLRHAIDHFHLPPTNSSITPERRKSWAEWHYFNVLLDEGRRWAFVTLMVAGDVPDGEWGGEVLITLHATGKPARRFRSRFSSAQVEFSTKRADLRVGRSRVEVQSDGSYHVVALATSENGSSATVDFVLKPARGAYFPGTMLAEDELTSGYAVPALRADASGRICEEGSCTSFSAAPAYHDHNWGFWNNVDWEWGTARAGQFSILFGRVRRVDARSSAPPLFLYVVDSLGFRTLLRPEEILYDEGRRSDEAPVNVPARGLMIGTRGRDTLRVELFVDDASATDIRIGTRGTREAVSRPWFLQMKGRVRLTGSLDGESIAAEGQGFFETFR